MAGKISQYPSSITTLASGDLFDVSEFLNPGYESKKLDWDDLLTNLNSQITFANIYTTDGTTTGERTISIGTNDLIFGSTGDVDLLRFDATADKIGIGIAAPSEKLHVNGNSQLAGQLSVNDNVNADVQMLLSTTLRDGINVGNTNSTGTQSSSIIGRNLSTHASGQATALRGTVQNNTTSGINVAVEGQALSTGTNYGAWFEAIGGSNNYALITGGGNVGIGTTTPTEKLEVAGNAKFSGTTYLNSSSIIGQTDNGDLAVGSNGNIGFVKKSGSFGVMAVGSTSNFVVRVSSSSNLAGTTAASTFTDIYHQENDTNVRIGRNDIAFRVDDDNGGVDPLDTLAQFQINTRSKTSITVDTLGRTTLGGTTANAEVILNTNDSTAIAAGLMVKNITGAQILALTPSNGMIAYATSTSGAISSVGFWGYENGAWVKL